MDRWINGREEGPRDGKREGGCEDWGVGGIDE